MVCNFLDNVEQSRLKEVCKEFEVLIIYYLAADSLESLTIDSDYILGVVFTELPKAKLKEEQFCRRFKNKLKATVIDSKVSVVFLQAEKTTVSFEIIIMGGIIYAGEEEKVVNYEDKIISRGLNLQKDLDFYADNFSF